VVPVQAFLEVLLQVYDSNPQVLECCGSEYIWTLLARFSRLSACAHQLETGKG
jgi:hypothetical protein